MIRRFGRSNSERGASLVEFALVAPLLFVLFIGMAEFGLAFKDRLTISNASSSAARVGSTLGTDPNSDYLILSAVKGALGGITPTDKITKVVIFKARPDGTIDGGLYNEYLPDAGSCGWIPCPDLNQGGAPAGGWLPSARDDLYPDMDTIGVQVHFTHTWITRILPFMSTPASWTDTARVRIEPQGFE